MVITKEQFKRYKRVQESGSYNMFSPEAMMAAGLSKSHFLEIMDNYDKLEKEHGKSK